LRWKALFDERLEDFDGSRFSSWIAKGGWCHLC
jgi:hypothetical protein